MTDQQPTVHYLQAYQPSDFLIDAVFLNFDLHPSATRVKAILHLRRNPEISPHLRAPLVLQGEDLKLLSIRLNDIVLSGEQFQLDEHQLTVLEAPDHFVLETEVEINPKANQKLSGLYLSRGTFCTQCESQGFRRITYYLDRPDVLAPFTTTITADRTQYPILLANGNLTASQELNDGRQWVKWEDPTWKPCYLFALVAGSLEVLEDSFITQSGRKVQLAIYVEPGKLQQTTHAMQSLKLAMRWDEETYGREYDLDRYMIVGVSDFNFGAMENKGLNIFNDKYILAQPETATDEDFVDVMSVIAHEYFHNWSGNRVTVRDWFQITLKEGLTVFREHQFTADHTSKTVKRIQEAKLMRNTQFAQDAGPMAHPIYPDSYIQINNFYTVTVYEKGSEVIRMLHTLLGSTVFRKAMDIYFTRNDGKPATVEDFLQAMESASGLNLQQFRRWYKQAGTPLLLIKDEYYPNTHSYQITITQTCVPTPDQSVKETFHIPFALGLLGADGQEFLLQLSGDASTVTEQTTTRILDITEHTQTFEFINIPSKPIPSLLRDFSAPVKLQYDYTEDHLIFLLRHDRDLFNRWDASQQLATRILLRLIASYQAELELPIPHQYLSVLGELLQDPNLDPSLLTEMLTLPAETYLIEQMPIADVDAIHAVREWLKKHIAVSLKNLFWDYYHAHQDWGVYQYDAQTMGKRRLKNLALMYLAHLADDEVYALCTAQCQRAHHMSDVMAGLIALNDFDCAPRAQALAAFYQKWRHETLVVDKWFRLHAISALPDTLKTVQSLLHHEAFDIKNPNRVRALIGSFCSANPIRFHEIQGEGYEFLVNHVLEIDRFNPQLAARIFEPMTFWKKYDVARQQLMNAQLERMSKVPSLSSDLYEILTKTLQHSG